MKDRIKAAERRDSTRKYLMVAGSEREDLG